MDQHVVESSSELAAPARAQPSRRAKLIGSGIAVVVLAALGGLAWYLSHQPAAGGPGGPGAGRGGPGGPGGFGRGGPPTTVGVATAEKMDIPVLLDALGTVTPAATVTVRPQVSGVLKQVLYKEGQMVRAGQVLAEIDPRQFEFALMQATGQRQRDEAQLDSARTTLQRYRTLLSQDSIARQDVDTQEATVKQLEGTLTTDKANEGTARLNLGYTKIVAPISARVGLRTVDVGNVVSPGDANGVAVLTQVLPIDVQFSVPQDQVPDLQGRINAGAHLPATALDRTRATPLETGSFAALDNQVDTQTGTVRAKARFANAKLNLFPSQFVNVRLLLRTIVGATVVPVTALRHAGSGDFVYVLNMADRTASVRPVTRGQSTVEKIEITSGLKVGEQVITEGADRLRDGAKVTLPGDKPAFGGGAAGGGRGGKGRHGAGASAAGGASASAAAEGPAGAAGAPAAAAAGADGAASGAQGAWHKRNADAAGADAAGAAASGADASGPGQGAWHKHRQDGSAAASAGDTGSQRRRHRPADGSAQ